MTALPCLKAERTKPWLMSTRLQFDHTVAVAHLSTHDVILAGLIERIGPFSLQLHRTNNLFEALLRSIIYQQLHGKAAATILGRVLAVLKPLGGPTPIAFTATADDSIRAAGLSRAKLAAARDLAGKCLDGTVPTWREAMKLSDDELITRLIEVRGIGPWTVHMLLIFHLGRPDVLPTGDFAIRLAFKKLYRKRTEPKAEAIIKYARVWQPYRSVACWYLWRSLD